MKNSISLRFNLLASALVITLLVAFGAYNQTQTGNALRASLDKQTNAVLGRLKQSLPPTLWNFETDQMVSIVESEVSASEIKGVFVYDTKEIIMGRMVNEFEKIVDVKKLPADAGLTKQTVLEFDDSGSVSKVGKVVILIDESAIDNLLDQSLKRTLIQLIVMVVLLVATITFLMRLIVIRPLAEIGNALSDISQGEGDLTRRLNANRRDEVGVVANHFNLFVDKIQHLVQQVVGSMNHMSELTQDLLEVAQTTNAGVQAQSKETDQVAAAINEMSATAHNISQNTSEAAEAAHHANDEALLAKSVVTASIDAIGHLAGEIDTGAKVINNLENDVSNITSMVDVIQSIAEQTNLLALNAAIEAARAGEQGRGFAVVADEVRTLASRTQSTTEEIQQMIDKLQTGAQSAVAVMESSKAKGESTVEEVNKTEESLAGIVSAVSTINDMSTQIASASEQQTAVSEEIGNSVTRIAEIADEAANGAKNTEESCIRLADLTQEIRNQLGQFKV
ncbi:methyl-accepting chemotaxis protein [Litoribrevibacter albus]|uniref:Methyl-accepting chemotaxis protein n=1 Tax=Litoribrevibacter albus TaxID=1473156 RepID=A0AA37W7A1_9GAMM|nr:methyl-accepting chemotaxis protein [Litoribrevibacter albus]GLQ31109.1 hypothetical protein GCM10007876_15880 [Litoribrevibacter albus]